VAVITTGPHQVVCWAAATQLVTLMIQQATMYNCLDRTYQGDPPMLEARLLSTCWPSVS
jgi:hypothetical protein